MSKVLPATLTRPMCAVLMTAWLAATATGLRAEHIVCDGILGNSGEQGVAIIRFPGGATSGLGIVCDRYGSLWDRGGTALNRYAPDGRLLASHKLPHT